MLFIRIVKVEDFFIYTCENRKDRISLTKQLSGKISKNFYILTNKVFYGKEKYD